MCQDVEQRERVGTSRRVPPVRLHFRTETRHEHDKGTWIHPHCGLTWGLGHTIADNNRGTRLQTGDEISSITLTRATCPLDLSGRTLCTAKHREQHTLIQIKEGEEVLHELLLASKPGPGSFQTAGATVDKGVVVWIWGTDDALRALRGVFGATVHDRGAPIDLDLGIEELTEPRIADLAALEGVALIDLRDRIAVLLLDSKGVTGMRFVSDSTVEDPAELYWLCLTPLSQHQMAGVEQLYLRPGCGDSVKDGPWPPMMNCCPKNCPQCCCSAHDTCTSGPDKATCDGLRECRCTGPEFCACRPQEQ